VIIFAYGLVDLLCLNLGLRLDSYILIFQLLTAALKRKLMMSKVMELSWCVEHGMTRDYPN